MKSKASAKFFLFILVILPIISKPGNAQYFSVGADPSSVKWRQVKTGVFNLVYPEKESHLAGLYSAALGNIGIPVTASMQASIGKLPVIIHPYSILSNGISVLAPRRIEIFPKQPVAQETADFPTQVTIHEIRHFAQMDRLNNGLTRIMGYILGEQAQAMVLGVHVPKWLLEGDAVLTETLLTPAGRGRLAGFIQPLRSRLMDNKDVSWDRVLFGSYNEILPNEYLYGYFFVARGRMLADPLVWSDAIGQIGKNPFNLKGLSGISQPKTGFRFSSLYAETMDWLHDFWSDPSLLVKTPDSLRIISRDFQDFRNYYRPQRLNDQEVVCLKTTMGDLPAFVAIDSVKNERILARPGTIEDAGFSCRNGKLYWTELVRDPRWENRSWSDLFCFDVKTGRKVRLTHGQRYFSPAISPTGERIAVVDEQADGSSFIRIIDPMDGRVISSISPAGGEHFSSICWGTLDELFAVTTGSEGRKLVEFNSRNPAMETLLDVGFMDISCPVVYQDWVYFSGPAGATQGLYRINKNSHILEFVFAHPHGINYLSSQGEDLFLSVYSSCGYRPARVSFRSVTGRRISRIEPLEEPVTEVIQRAENEFPVGDSDPIPTAEAKPYNKFAHLFRLHSWSPVFLNPDSYQISPGAVMMSQNDLSTLTCWAGYQYIKTDLSHNLVASARYTGSYPTIEINIGRKYRSPDILPGSAVDEPDRFLEPVQQNLRIGSSVPLIFSTGAWNRRVEPGLFYEQINYPNARRSVSDNALWMAGISLSCSILRKTSYRDLFPKWGLVANLSCFKAFSLSRRGNNITARTIVYLPGLLPNSSLRILNSIRQLSFNIFDYSIQDFPRGQVVLSSSQNYNLKIDYAFPVSYPDYHLSGLFYVNRIKANLFFDAGTNIYYPNWFLSTGIDLTFDYHILRVGVPLESGVRMIYFPMSRKIGAEFLFSFSVN